MRRFMITVIFGLISGTVAAEGWHATEEAMWDTHAARWLTLPEVAAQIHAGSIIVFGEDHANPDNAQLPSTYIHHDNQVRLIEQLQKRASSARFRVSVGMEFLSYNYQAKVDQFLNSCLSELGFLQAVQWGNAPFTFYRRQILAPRLDGAKTVALNIPRSIASQVARSGPTGLSEEQRRWLPPLWQRGNASYFARFREIMQDHVPAEQLENYFWAQSLWDDTMAWRALVHQTQSPRDVLVIIVGSFHAEFGGGLPFEIKQQSPATVKTVLQIEASDWTAATLEALTQPHPKYGLRADYLWLHHGAELDIARNVVTTNAFINGGSYEKSRRVLVPLHSDLYTQFDSLSVDREKR